MFESKYSKVLTIILVVVILGIIGLLGFLGYDYYKNYTTSKEAEDFVNEYQDDIQVGDANQSENEAAIDGNIIDQLTTSTSNNNQTTQKVRPTFNGFGVLGTMEIPKTNFRYPILEKMTKASIETAVAFLYGVGVNQPGNTVIVGHNYRNGAFFSNNKKLEMGDKIYITDNDGVRMTYSVTNKFETTDTDTTFYQRDTEGKPEVTLSTCTDDGKLRLIIFARAD